VTIAFFVVELGYSPLSVRQQRHTNTGPVSILFDSPVARQLLMVDLYVQQLSNIHSNIGAFHNEFRSGSSDEERQGDRLLQGSRELTTLTLTFTRCLFVVSEHL